MELSEEFILDLTQVQQLLFGFLFKRLGDDRGQLRGNGLLSEKSGARALARQD